VAIVAAAAELAAAVTATAVAATGGQISDARRFYSAAATALMHSPLDLEGCG